MSQTSQVVDTIKKILREKRITYADVANHLALSEANVKRMFSRRHFTLDRLEEICTLAEVDLEYLIQRMQEDSKITSELDKETETELVNNIKLLIIAQLLINRWTVEEIKSAYTFDEHETIRLLARLDKLGIIELLPGNRVRTLISRHFKWVHNGPVQKFFKQQVAQEFFNCSFKSEAGELLIFSYGQLTRASNAQMQKAMVRLAREFDDICKEDAKQPLDQTYGTGITIAMRPWELSVFNQYRREPNNKRF